MNAFGLPTLRSLDAAAWSRSWPCTASTDMRCGFNRLPAMAEEITGDDPACGHRVVFRNRRGVRLKILCWDAGGYVLFHKQLETGVFSLPRAKPTQRCVTLRASTIRDRGDGGRPGHLRAATRWRCSLQWEPGPARRR